MPSSELLGYLAFEWYTHPHAGITLIHIKKKKIPNPNTVIANVHHSRDVGEAKSHSGANQMPMSGCEPFGKTPCYGLKVLKLRQLS